MGAIAGVLVLGGAIMLQTAVFSRLTLLNGAADVILLLLLAWALQKQAKTRDVLVWTAFAAIFVGFISAVPPLLTIMIYVVVVFAARWIQFRIWQGVLLAYFFSVVLATFFQQGLTLVVLRYLNGTPLPLETSFVYVMLPSLVLNLLFAFPIYLLMKDLADWIYPAEVDSYV
jgi:hypothetical protein